MKKTKLTRSLMAACSIVALTAVLGGCLHDGSDDAPATDPPDAMDPMPMDASGYIALTDEQRDALLGVLPMNGDSVELNVGADGVERAGVTFTCMSDYRCTVTVSNSAGTIVAMWASQTLGDGTASAMASGLEPAVDAFPHLNAGSTESIRNILDGADGTTVSPELTPTELVGMGIGGPGVLNADEAGLRGSIDPNTAAATGTAGGPGAVSGLEGGSMITGADHGIDHSMSDIAAAPDGWGMKTLFRDWGDAAGDAGDGGFETAAIVVKNLGDGTEYRLRQQARRTKYVNNAAQAMFSVEHSGQWDSMPGVTYAGNIGRH